MLQNITLSAEKVLIERARQRAEAQKTTLNAEFRRWLAEYIEYPQTAADFAVLMDQLNYIQPGETFTRIDMNER
jgi:hypothetical protein